MLCKRARRRSVPRHRCTCTACGRYTDPECGCLSATAAGGSAPFADVAAAAGTHLGAAGQAERRVDTGAGDLLEELGGRMSALRNWLRTWDIHLVGSYIVAVVVLERLRLTELFLRR